jgi:hypothetical protein
MNTQATKVIALPDNPAVRQLSEMACPEGSRITSCQRNHNVKLGPNGLVLWWMSMFFQQIFLFACGPTRAESWRMHEAPGNIVIANIDWT